MDSHALEAGKDTTPEMEAERMFNGNKEFVERGGMKSIKKETGCVCSCCMDTRVQKSCNCKMGLVTTVDTPGSLMRKAGRIAVEKAIKNGALIIFLEGHTDCGALSATFDWVKYGKSITDPDVKLVADQLVPAAQMAIQMQEEALAKGTIISDNQAKDLASELNQRSQLNRLMSSLMVENYVKNWGVIIVETMYNVREEPYVSLFRPGKTVKMGEFGVMEITGKNPIAEAQLGEHIAKNQEFRIEKLENIRKVAKGQTIRVAVLNCTSKDTTTHTIMNKQVDDGYMAITSPGIMIKDRNIMGGVMYAVRHGAKVIDVNMHTDCSIIKAMFEQMKNGKEIRDVQMAEVAENVADAVSRAIKEQKKYHLTDEETINRAAEIHTENVARELLKNDFIKERIKNGKLIIIGTVTNTRNDEVTLANHMTLSGEMAEVYRITAETLRTWIPSRSETQRQEKLVEQKTTEQKKIRTV